MDTFTTDDWDRVCVGLAVEQADVAARVLDMLRSLRRQQSGFPVDQLEHALQTATRADRAGASDALVLAALCHDLGKVVSVPNHPAIAAEMLRPYLPHDVCEVVRTHQDFQGRHYDAMLGRKPDARDAHRHEPWFATAVVFTDEWDQVSFDPGYRSLPLDHFEPLVRQAFAAPTFRATLVSRGLQLIDQGGSDT